MIRVDLSNRSRLHDLTAMVREISSLHDPVEVQRVFARAGDIMTRSDGYIGFSVRNMPEGQYKITRRLLLAEDQPDVQHDPWSSWGSIPAHTGGFFGEAMQSPECQLYHHLNVRDDPALGDTLAPFGSVILAPLFDEGQALNWSMIVRREPEGFTPEEAEEFMMRANMGGRMTRGLVLKREVEELNQRLVAQLDEISSIQRSLLPDRIPKIPGMDVAASYLTSNEAGGDYYDVFPLGDDRWGLCVADVSGHGAGAATVVAMMSAIIHSHQERDRGPGAMLTHLNQQLTARRIESNFVTAFMGTWEPASRKLTFANAGHHAPSHRLGSGEVTQIEGAHDIPLGVLDDTRYEQSTVTLGTGDTLVLYTDGITEAFSPPPEREMFGMDRLVSALEGCSGEPPCVIDSIHERLFEHTRSRTRDDDQTILAARITV
ncbi:MAG: PP2C family protein-serine/threonine phosphatase [Planctomycetota bacterium]